MSGQYDNRNRGSAWLSKQKYPEGPRTPGVIKGKGKPDYNGSVNIEGRDYYFDMWLRPEDSENPKAPAFTFKVKPKDAAPEGHPDRFQQATPVNRQRPTERPRPVGGELGDDIPFRCEDR